MFRFRRTLMIPVLIVIGFGAGLISAAPPQEKKPMQAHNVYFSLNDSSEAAREKLVAECHAYLADIPGIVFYAAGTVADLDRPVNDRNFDVGLHVVFENAEAGRAYQVHPQHNEFVARNKDNWARVRVFDSDVTRKP